MAYVAENMKFKTNYGNIKNNNGMQQLPETTVK